MLNAGNPAKILKGCYKGKVWKKVWEVIKAGRLSQKEVLIKNYGFC